MNRLVRHARIEPFSAPAALVGPWLVHAHANRVVRDGVETRLAPKVMGVLRCLMSRPYQVVSREELLDGVWPEAEVGEEVLTQTIAELRRALGESARDGQCIETIRKVGYLLRAPVMPLEQAPPPAPDDAARGVGEPLAQRVDADPLEPAPVQAPVSAPVAASVAASRAPRAAAGIAFAIAMALLLAAVIAGAWRTTRRGDGSTRDGDAGIRVAAIALHPRPLTTDLGSELMPAVSPDGTAVAYVQFARRGTGLFEELRVRGIGAAASELVASSGPDEGYVHPPAWSADGRSIAYARTSGARCRIVAASAIGGAGDERTLTPCDAVDESFLVVDFSPDGRSLALVRRVDPADPASALRIHRLDFASGAVQPLEYTTPAGNSRRPQYSPDGRQMAFMHGTPGGFFLYVMPADGGSPVQLTRGDTRALGYTWAPDSRAIVYSDRGRLVRIDVATLALKDLGVTEAVQPSHARRRDVLAYMTRLSGPLNLQRYLLDSVAGYPMSRPRDLLFASTLHSYMPRWSPDGASIAFVSDRTGGEQLWVGPASGERARQLSTLGEGERIEEIAWLPDNRTLALAWADGEKKGHVALVSVGGDAPRELWRHDARIVSVAASSDGESIYVVPIQSDAQGSDARARRIALPGGAVEPLALTGAQRIADGGDGYLYFDRVGDSGIFRIAANGGEPQRLDGSARTNPASAWVLAPDQIVLWASTEGGEALMAIPRGGATTPHLYAGITGTFGHRDFSLSPDARGIVFPVDGERESDLMVIEDQAALR